MSSLRTVVGAPSSAAAAAVAVLVVVATAEPRVEPLA